MNIIIEIIPAISLPSRRNNIFKVLLKFKKKKKAILFPPPGMGYSSGSLKLFHNLIIHNYNNIYNNIIITHAD